MLGEAHLQFEYLQFSPIFKYMSDTWKNKTSNGLKKYTATLDFFFSFEFSTSRSALSLSLSPISPPTKPRNLPEMKSHNTKQIDPGASVVEIRRGHCWRTTH